MIGCNVILHSWLFDKNRQSVEKPKNKMLENAKNTVSVRFFILLKKIRYKFVTYYNIRCIVIGTLTNQFLIFIRHSFLFFCFYLFKQGKQILYGGKFCMGKKHVTIVQLSHRSLANSSWVNLDHHHSMDIEMCYPVGDLNYLNKKGRRSEIVFLGVFMDAYPNSI